MDHKQRDELLMQALFGELDANGRTVFDAAATQDPTLQKDLESLQRTADIAAHTPQAAPPRGFTFRVLDQLPEKKRNALWALLSSPLSQCAPQPRTCALFFITAAFYYLVTAVLLTLVLRQETAAPVHYWLQMQPVFALGAAIVFSGVGILLLHDGDMALKIALAAAAAQALLMIVNGGVLQSALGSHDTAGFTFLYTLMGMFVGTFLADAAYRTWKSYGHETI